MTMKPFPTIDLAATGRKIVSLRKARGLSVTDLQKYFNFEAPQAIYKWQKGQCLPSTDNLFALAVILEVSVDDILQSGQQTLPQEESCGSVFLLFS